MERRSWPMSTRVTNSSGLLFELLWPNDRLSWYKERLVLEAAAYNVLALHKGVLEKSTKTALNKNSLPCIHEPKNRNTEILIPKIQKGNQKCQFSPTFPYASAWLESKGNSQASCGDSRLSKGFSGFHRQEEASSWGYPRPTNSGVCEGFVYRGPGP